MYSLLPYEEIKQLLAERFDEVTLLEIFNISSEDLIERFSDYIENDPDKYLDILREISLEGYEELDSDNE